MHFPGAVSSRLLRLLRSNTRYCHTNRVLRSMGDKQFSPQYRVRRGGDFRRAYQRRSTVADQQIVIFGHPNGLSYPRLGISASRRLGGAVVRNRWKRLLREAFRLTRTELPEGIDLIVIPRPRLRRPGGRWWTRCPVWPCGWQRRWSDEPLCGCPTLGVPHSRPGADRGGPALSVAHQSAAGPPLPFRAQLQRLFHRVGAEIRGGSRCLPRRLAHLPLPPLESRRL